MATEADYKTKIATYLYGDLLTLWESIQKEDTPNWGTGKAFEYLIIKAFELEGAEVRYPYRVKDEEGKEIVEEIDGVIYSDGLACLIEAKDQKDKVNVEPIAKLRNQLLQRPYGILGVIFSRSGFSPAAKDLAKYVMQPTVLLWTGEEVGYALHKKAMRKGLLIKYRRAIELARPYFDIRAEEIP